MADDTLPTARRASNVRNFPLAGDAAGSPDKPQASPKRQRAQSQKWRMRFVADSAIEIFRMAEFLQREVHSLGSPHREYEDVDPSLLRGFAIRLDQLSAVLSRTADEAETEDGVFGLLYGPTPAADRERLRKS